MIEVTRWKAAVSALITLFAVTAFASTDAKMFTSLISFNYNDGARPWSVVQGRDGNFYGATYYGTKGGGGTVFRITSDGALTTLYQFCSPGCNDFAANGGFPQAALVQSTNGNFYGTTSAGGTNASCQQPAGCGTIFEITRNGTLTTLYNFPAPAECSNNPTPGAALVEGSNGELYGTTCYGGVNGDGTVFRFSADGTVTTLYSFCSQAGCADGESPQAGLIQGVDGNFYGTTYSGGVNNGGTVFRITPGGTLTTLYSFCAQVNCSDGTAPIAGLVEATKGKFYGTTYSGGLHNSGTVFEIDSSGTLSTLYNFCSQSNCADGSFPSAALVLATNGHFYGTTSSGGIFCGTFGGCGTVFEINAKGGLSTLHSFGFGNGAYPSATLLQATNGGFLGTTAFGGTGTTCGHDCGTMFSLSVGLGPFVTFVRASGKVGETGGILGQGFTGTTNVMLNGVPANFKVISDTYLTATIPQGATTGFVTVTTHSGVLTSNVPFHVIP